VGGVGLHQRVSEQEATLRQAGAKTDVYAVFQRMLARGELPSDIDALTRRGSEIEA
jgi:toxin with endonuclease activity of toxin-antitoxin system